MPLKNHSQYFKPFVMPCSDLQYHLQYLKPLVPHSDSQYNFQYLVLPLVVALSDLQYYSQYLLVPLSVLQYLLPLNVSQYLVVSRSVSQYLVVPLVCLNITDRSLVQLKKGIGDYLNECQKLLQAKTNALETSIFQVKKSVFRSVLKEL